MLNRLLEPRLPFGLGSRKFILFLALILIFVLLLPWVAFSTGKGKLTAIDPNERAQSLTAPISGFVREWHAKEGEFKKKGELICLLSDNDLDITERFAKEKAAAQAALNSARLMKDTALINLSRQKKLFEEGISARKEYEKAKIEFSKLEMEESKALVTLTKSETQLSRQLTQEVRAPRDGYIVRILPGERGQLIKAGAPIVVFSPVITSPAVELWVDGVDAPQILAGQKARVQFEGWPSLQVPGWPSVAINTFEAKVLIVDQASSYKGLFRVLLVPDGQWPSQKILRFGVNAKGNIQLSDSFILREIWRKLNNYPAFPDPIQEEIKKMSDAYKEDSSLEENKQ